jgi:hypothetical protein
MTGPAQQYDGTLRVRITPSDGRRVTVEWFVEETGEVVWTEGVNLRDGIVSFVSQIRAEGHFEPTAGCFVDAAGKRHFVLNAKAGLLGACYNP